MALNHTQRGNVLPVILTAAVASGELFLVGDRVAIALGAGGIGDKISAQFDEVFTVPKFADDDMGQCVQVYFDAANKRVTLDANGGANKLAGVTALPAGATVTSVELKLNG